MQAIKSIGIEIESVTCDGASSILKVVREVCPDAILQRCTFHIAKDVSTLLTTRKPKNESARELKELVELLSKIESQQEAQLWIIAFVDWHKKNREFINQKTADEITGRWWYTHKGLHRSTTHIIRAIPCMFNWKCT